MTQDGGRVNSGVKEGKQDSGPEKGLSVDQTMTGYRV
jgi:hypothetical protein